MPIILYTLETNSASYLSSSSVIPEGYARVRVWRSRIMRVSFRKQVRSVQFCAERTEAGCSEPCGRSSAGLLGALR